MEKRATAFIEALQGSFKGQRAEVIFNPAEYSLAKGNQFASTPLPGLSNPVLSFVNGESDTLTMDLFFDTFPNKGAAVVRVGTEKFSRRRGLYSQLHAPPPYRFVGG